LCCEESKKVHAGFNRVNRVFSSEKQEGKASEISSKVRKTGEMRLINTKRIYGGEKEITLMAGPNKARRRIEKKRGAVNFYLGEV